MMSSAFTFASATRFRPIIHSGEVNAESRRLRKRLSTSYLVDAPPLGG